MPLISPLPSVPGLSSVAAQSSIAGWMNRARLRSAVILFAMLAAGCNTPGNTLRPASDFGDWIASVYWETIGWYSLVLGLVVVMLLLILLKYSTRRKEVREPPVHVAEHLILEAAWTVGPSLILLLVAIPSMIVTFAAKPNTPPRNALHVVVYAHQWWWEFHYPSLGIVTANEAHILVNRPVYFELHTDDVIHSFWVPRLGGKQDIIPNHTNELILTANRPGEFYGECAEFCGLSHANMRMRVFVDTPARFRRWVADQRSVPRLPTPATPDYQTLAEGRRVFEGAPCAFCHGITGLSTSTIAPNLSHFASRTTLAGGTLPNTPPVVAAWVEHPYQLKPGAHMPSLALDHAQLTALVAFLESLH